MHLIITVLYLIFVSGGIENNAAPRWSCGDNGPQGPIRNTNVCTLNQLEKAAINLTLQVQSYIIPYDPDSLFSMVSALTPVYQNYAYSIPNLCCQSQLTMFQYYDISYANGMFFNYFNSVPMGAVWNQMAGEIKVYAVEVMYPLISPFNPVRTHQIVYTWKPQYQCGVAVNRTTCNLKLDRIELRDYQCSFAEAPCD